VFKTRRDERRGNQEGKEKEKQGGKGGGKDGKNESQSKISLLVSGCEWSAKDLLSKRNIGNSIIPGTRRCIGARSCAKLPYGRLH